MHFIYILNLTHFRKILEGVNVKSVLNLNITAKNCNFIPKNDKNRPKKSGFTYNITTYACGPSVTGCFAIYLRTSSTSSISTAPSQLTSDKS